MDLYTFPSYRHPEHADLIARVLAIQTKKAHTTILTYLNKDEVTAVLNAPDRSTEPVAATTPSC